MFCNTNAIHNLGNWYFYGLGAEQNVDEGLKYYRMAAEQGNPLSQCMLGSLYYYGMAVEQDYDKAFEYLPEGRAGGRVSAEIKQTGWLRHLPGHLKHRINTAGTLSQDGEQ